MNDHAAAPINPNAVTGSRPTRSDSAPAAKIATTSAIDPTAAASNASVRGWCSTRVTYTMKNVVNT